MTVSLVVLIDDCARWAQLPLLFAAKDRLPDWLMPVVFVAAMVGLVLGVVFGGRRSGTPSRADHRRAFRYKVSMRAAIRLPGPTGDWEEREVRVIEVSLNGGQLECAKPIEPRTNIVVKLANDEVPARVVRVVRQRRGFFRRVYIASLALESTWPPRLFTELAFPGKQTWAQRSDAMDQFFR